MSKPEWIDHWPDPRETAPGRSLWRPVLMTAYLALCFIGGMTLGLLLLGVSL